MLTSTSPPSPLLLPPLCLPSPGQIALGECYRVRFRGVHSKAFVRNLYVSCLYKELGSFLFGCCIGQSLTNMAKLSIGRLRPNFLSVCNVTYASIDCIPGSSVSHVTCQQPNHKMVEEARSVQYCTVQDRGGVCVCVCLLIEVMNNRSVFFLSLSGSLSPPATLLLPCTPCSTWR